MKPMKDNHFIDTNILVYCYSNDEPNKREVSRSLVNSANVTISTQVLTELSNVLRKRFNLQWEEIESVLIETASNFTIHINLPETIAKACRIAKTYNFSFYDSLIISAAIESNCSRLFSEDMHDGMVIEEKLTIINPFK